MIGCPWHRIAVDDFGAKLKFSPRRDKVYLYQPFTDFFVEFETAETMEAFRNYADCVLGDWDCGHVVVIDTNIDEQYEAWITDIEDIASHITPFSPPPEHMKIPDDALFYMNGVGRVAVINDGATIWTVAVPEEESE